MRKATKPLSREEPHADGAMLGRSLGRNGEDVVVREARGSTVYSAGDRSYKLLTPTKFNDAPSVAARARACHREIELNAKLAPGVMLRVRAVVPSVDQSGYVLADADDLRAIDHVVEMRRIDEASTMEALVRRGVMTPEQAFAVGARVARFHGDAASRSEGTDYRALVDRNFETLLPLAENLVPARERLALQRFAAAFLLGWAGVLEARAREGSVIDGHGDMRAGNVLFDSGNVLLIGRSQFDAPRVVDVADELASLLMELSDLTGAQDVGDAMLRGYSDAGGGSQPEALLAFFGAYRAQVRATAALSASQAGAESSGQSAIALRLLAMSSRLGWRARGPLLLLITGPAAAGKSTLAKVLGRTSGMPVLSPNLRAPEPGLDQSDGSHEGTEEAYADLARRAGRERAVIIDANFEGEHLQRAFTDQLAGGGAAEPFVIDCRAPAEVRVARASAHRRREAISGASSPGTRLRADRSIVIRGVAADAHHAVDTRAPLSMQVDEVASWLDSLLAAGRGA